MENPFSRTDWDSVRIFLAVAEVGSFNKAAEKVGATVNTVRRSVKRLEDEIGYPLFLRDAEGARLTPEARRLVVAARDVETSMTDMWRVAAAAANTMAGPIRLAVTEGLGAFWLMPQLVQYVDEQAGRNRIELQCAMRSVDVLRLEADISVQLVEPTSPSLIVRRLGYLHLVPWASAGYLKRFGTPRDLPDLVSHRIVEQEADQVQSYALEQTFGKAAAERMVLLKTNFSSGHYWAVMNGAGIGIMPSYARMIGGLVEHVDIGGFHLRTPIYMSVHPEVMRSARHAKFVEWLTEAFSSRRYPWFGERYITPADMERAFNRAMLKDYFVGVVASA